MDFHSSFATLQAFSIRCLRMAQAKSEALLVSILPHVPRGTVTSQEHVGVLCAMSLGEQYTTNELRNRISTRDKIFRLHITSHPDRPVAVQLLLHPARYIPTKYETKWPAITSTEQPSAPSPSFSTSAFSRTPASPPFPPLPFQANLP